MAKSYQEHFNQRGSAYEQAMRRFPLARAAEFQQVIDAALLKPNMSVADVPAGGGYLRQFLPEHCTWHGHEPCASFRHHSVNGTIGQPLLPLPWPENSLDAAISLAGVHHLQDKRPLFRELHRILKPQARFVLSDVEEHSSVARFLDEYIGAHNSTGHEGIYLNGATLNQLEECGFAIELHQHNRFHWQFETTDDMAAFSQQLFDVRSASCAALKQAIRDYLGITQINDQCVGMRWSLTTITATKR